MDLSKVKEWKIPEGNVVSVQDSSGKIIWTAPVVRVKIVNWCGAPGITQNGMGLDFNASFDFGNTWTSVFDVQNMNSYSNRIYIRLTEETLTSEDHLSYIIASGEQMSTIYDEVFETLIAGTGTTWEELKTKILNTTPEVFEEQTIYGLTISEIDLSKYTPTQMMGNPIYIEPNYPLYIFFGNDYTDVEIETATWDLKSQTVDASKTIIPVVTNADLVGSHTYLLGTPDVSWISWDTSIETDATICLVVDENTRTSDRSGTVSLYADSGMTLVDTVTITQKGKTSGGEVTKEKPYWNLKSSYKIDYTEQDVTPEIVVTDPDNVGWSIESDDKNLYEIDGTFFTWNISGEGSESTGYLLSASENRTVSSKVCTVTLSSEGQIISTCIITQLSNPSSGGVIDPGEIVKPPVSEEEFDLSTTTLTLNPTGAAKSLTINYSGSWTIAYAAEGTFDGTTLKFSQISGTGNTTVNISASMPNAGASVRAWLVTVKTSTGLIKTCRVYQQCSTT